MIASHARSARPWVTMRHVSDPAGSVASVVSESIRYAPRNRRTNSSRNPAIRKPTASRPQLDAPPAAREPDGQYGEHDRDEPEPVRESLEDTGTGLCRLELVGADDRDLAGRLGKLLGDPPDDRHLLAEVDDDGSEVEHDLPAGRRDELALVVEELDELPLRGGRHAHPCLLQAGPLEEPVRGLLRPLPGDPRQHRSERLLRLRQALGERLLDVDVRVQLLDRRRRHLLADVVGADQLGRDRLEPVLVEDRPLEVERDRADEEEDERDDVRIRAAIARPLPDVGGLVDTAPSLSRNASSRYVRSTSRCRRRRPGRR